MQPGSQGLYWTDTNLKKSLLDNLQHQFPKTGICQVGSEMEQVNGYTELAH